MTPVDARQEVDGARPRRADPDRPGGRRRPWTWAIVVAAGVLVTAWLVAGLTPHLVAGAWGAFPEPWAPAEGPADGDPLRAAYEVTDPPGGQAEIMVSFRNAGRLPVTISPAQQRSGVIRAVRLARIEPTGVAAERVDTVTVPPGGEVAVFQTVGFPCATFGAGSGTGPGDLRLVVRTLGLPREVALRQPADVTLWTSQHRTCAGE